MENHDQARDARGSRLVVLPSNRRCRGIEERSMPKIGGLSFELKKKELEGLGELSGSDKRHRGSTARKIKVVAATWTWRCEATRLQET